MSDMAQDEHNTDLPEGLVDEAILRDTDPLEAEKAEDFAKKFLLKVARLRVVRIDREAFLRAELRKLALSDAVLARALATTPAGAGVSLAQLDELARATIAFETSKSAAASFVAGLPGGFAIAATIPGDITQYYVHAFRIMQKLAYLYGWQDFIGDLDDADDETLGKFALFLGVMMGVGGAANSLTAFATQIARPALQKQIASQALTKTAWYGPMKQTLRLIGVKLTKDSLAKTVTKVVPVAGGVVSGGLTLVSLRSQSQRLRKHLRELPPPGVDAATHLETIRVVDEAEAANQSIVSKAVKSAGTGVKDATAGAANASVKAASQAGSAASHALGSAGERAGELFKGRFGKKAGGRADEEPQGDPK